MNRNNDVNDEMWNPLKETLKKYGWTINEVYPFKITHNDGNVCFGKIGDFMVENILHLDYQKSDIPLTNIDYISLISPKHVTKEDELRIDNMIELLNNLKKELNLKMIVNGKVWNIYNK